MAELSIVIVNYKSGQLILDCLASLFSHTTALDFEIIIVDNSASDDDKTRLLQTYPKLKWIDMGYNSGFARANNAGINAASAKMVLLLNPDTIVVDNSITECFWNLNTDECIGAGVQLIDPEGSPQISGHYFMKGGFNLVLPIPYWGNFLRWLGYAFKTKVPNVPIATGRQEVDWVSGAFMMVKKDPLSHTGLFDEDFFLYAEEVEWCSRLRKYGKLCIYGNLKIIHLQGEAVNKDQQTTEKGYYGLYDKKDLQLMVSNHVRVRKQFGVFWFLFLLVNYTWGVLFFAVAGFLHRLFTLRNPFGHLGKVFAFGKNVAKIWALSPTIIRNKPHFYKLL